MKFNVSSSIGEKKRAEFLSGAQPQRLVNSESDTRFKQVNQSTSSGKSLIIDFQANASAEGGINDQSYRVDSGISVNLVKVKEQKSKKFGKKTVIS